MGVLFLGFFLVCDDAFIWMWREGNVEGEHPVYFFSSFSLSLSVLHFSHHTFAGKLLCCQDLSCLSMRYLASESVEWHLFQWRKNRVARGGANELWQTPPFSFMEFMKWCFLGRQISSSECYVYPWFCC